MNKISPSAGPSLSTPSSGDGGKRDAARIHPVVIYPFRSPGDYSDLVELYKLVARIASESEVYTRPITVIDCKTNATVVSDPSHREFRRDVLEAHSDVVDAWCVDTCQMWYTGLGKAYERGKPGDVYWLIPGDFNYASAAGKQVLSELHDLPEIVLDLGQDICIGEISTDPTNSKELIDTYGTFALLYNWFPSEAREIREYTGRPRSEFFAITHVFLGQMLHQRWYPYEQTVVMLLRAASANRRISRFCVGQITDLESGRESLSSAVQQVERTERVLKSVWRERHQSKPDWIHQYRTLEERSDQVRKTAIGILQNLLT